MCRKLLLGLFFATLSAVQASAQGPSRERIASFLNALVPESFEVASFDYKNFPSKVEAGVGRTNIVGELTNTEAFYVDSNGHTWMRRMLSDEGGLSPDAVDALIAEIDGGEDASTHFKEFREAVGYKDMSTRFETNVRYRETVEGFDMRGTIRSPLDDVEAKPRSELYDNEYVRATPRGTQFYHHVKDYHERQVAKSERGDRIIDRISTFLETGAREVTTQDGDIVETLFALECPELSRISEDRKPERFRYFAAVCDATAKVDYEFNYADTAYQSGADFPVRVVLTQNIIELSRTPLHTVSLVYQLKKGTRCDNWCTANPRNDTGEYLWQDGEFFYDRYRTFDINYAIRAASE